MIAVLGSINIDLIASTEHLPERGETILGKQLLTAAGGKGANQVLAAQRAGGRTVMAGAVGVDSFAEPALANLSTAGVDINLVRRVNESTGTALIVVDRIGDNMITVIGGANNALTNRDAEAVIETLSAGDTLLMQLEIPPAVVEHALRTAKQRNIRTILNTAPAVAEAAALAQLADVVIANENEFHEFANASACTTLDPRLTDLALDYGQHNHAQTLIITRGENGVVAVRDGEVFETLAPAIDPLDTVGAGDTFCGYFAKATDEGQALEQALRLGTVAATRTCMYAGAQTAIPTARQVAEFARTQQSGHSI